MDGPDPDDARDKWIDRHGVDRSPEAEGDRVDAAYERYVQEGMQLVRDGGTYVVVGQYTDAGTITVNPHLDINKKHVTIKGCWGSDFSHFYLAVKFVEQYADKFPWDRIISREYSLEEAAQALQDVKNYKIMKAVIKPN